MVPAAKVTNPAKVELGKKLWFDPRLSRSGFHLVQLLPQPQHGRLGQPQDLDWRQVAEGPINSPTVLNSSLNVAQFWDGRAKDLKEQAGGPIANPGEMAFTHDLAVDMLRSIPQLRGRVQAACLGQHRHRRGHPPSPPSKKPWSRPTRASTNGSRATRRAITPRSCVATSCSSPRAAWPATTAPAVGGNMFQKMGLVEPYKTDNPAEGRSAVTGNDADRFNFKVPTLRNVELTYPYFHDGAANTLAEAVDTMGRIQLGRVHARRKTRRSWPS
jgi:cytochrome c peroxidase